MMIAVVGPTASGKTSLAFKLAKKLDAAIINFDAYQIYKELNIGTAKPTKEELSEVENYLFSEVSILDEMNIYNYQKACRSLIKSLLEENKNIILVGGSGLYLRSTIYDYSFQEDEKIDLSKYENLTNEELFKKLEELDPASATKIHPNNRKRVIRALSIAENSSLNKSNFENLQSHKLIYDIEIIGLNPEREELYKNIDKRVDLMFEEGLCEEVEKIYSKYDKNLTSLQAIGYKEFQLGLSKEETKELIKKNTRHYAKRQLTFFKHQFDDVKWFKNEQEALQYIESNLK